MSLTTHKDLSVTLTAERNQLCLEAAWELDALAELLPTVTTKDIPEATKTGYQVRAIADRIKTLASVLMSGLGDSIDTTDDLERKLKVTG